LIQTGFEHLGRFAFYTRDNPFVSKQAALVLDSTHPEELARLLDGEIEVEEWLKTDLGQRLLGSITVGSVPRDVHLLVRGGQPVVGVDSVHAFLHAELFWWLVSILWCISVSKPVEAHLGEGVMGFRFEKAFLEDPASGGMMLADQPYALKQWKGFPKKVREEHPGEYLTTAELDLRAFYYSIDVGPGAILRRFFASHGKRSPNSPRVRTLTKLLAALHRRYAELCTGLEPRKGDLGREGRRQLPVGLPSSQVLANLVISMVLAEISEEPETVAVAAYADDIVVLSRELPQLGESATSYFARLGLLGREPFQLQVDSTRKIARLLTSDEKMAISYARHVPNAAEEAKATKRFRERIGLSARDEEEYPDHDNPDWDGRLTTVFRRAHKRERVPRKLRNDILRLLEEVRVGLPVAESAKRYERLSEELDRRLFVALRGYWRELIVIALAARGPAAVEDLTTALREIIDTLEMPAGTKQRSVRTLRFGLRQSWYQALAQAIAVATDKDDRVELKKRMPRVRLGLPAKKSRTMRGVIDHAMRIRRRRLIPSSLVAVPLAEFSEWRGALIGPDAFARFLNWRRAEQPKGADPQVLASEVSESLRFINLHEACLAIHLWAGEDREEWLQEAFGVLSAQPLIDEELVSDLQHRSQRTLALEREEDEGAGDPGGDGGEAEEDGEDLDVARRRLPRIGMPSMPIDDEQLKAAIRGDTAELGQIASRSRGVLQTIVFTAANHKVDFLVLPEWSIVPQLVPWLMDQVSSKQMLVIGGQAPEVVGTTYWNKLWTGIPLTDSFGHHACLVPPPRQKHFLSPHEEADMAKVEPPLEQAPSERQDAKAYAWRGMFFASLLCFEFADLEFRRDLRFNADVITVSSLNRDWHYFDAIQDSTTRDNYCLTICVNTGSYPGTRIVRPTRSEMAVTAAVHGSDHPAVITKRIDMWPIVAAHTFQGRPAEVIPGYEPKDKIELCMYKPYPPQPAAR
jgi:hypothetical protein